MKIGDVELEWLGHDGFFIKNSKMIYIDPYNIKDDSEKADIILITHSHYDHCSFADLKKIVKQGTFIVLTADSQSQITRFEEVVEIRIVEPWQELTFEDIKISTIPAYNLDKSFHPKNEGWVGYIVKINGVIIYHAGDTDLIPDMQKLTGYMQPGKQFVALLPVGGRFTMSVDEAIEAAKIIKPTLAIPMHWGSIIGSEEDAKEFVQGCKEEGIDALVLEKE
jgi:L-ascorbate metabolism protein UlaG (beta-lactamase superfamily)